MISDAGQPSLEDSVFQTTGFVDATAAQRTMRDITGEETREQRVRRLREEKAEDIKFTEIRQEQGEEAFFIAKRNSLVGKIRERIGDESVSNQKAEEVMRKLFILDETSKKERLGEDVLDTDTVNAIHTEAEKRMTDFRNRNNDVVAEELIAEVVDFLQVDLETFLLFLVSGNMSEGKYSKKGVGADSKGVGLDYENLVDAGLMHNFLLAAGIKVGIDKSQMMQAIKEGKLTALVSSRVHHDEKKAKNLLYYSLKLMGRSSEANQVLNSTHEQTVTSLMELCQLIDYQKNQAPQSTLSTQPAAAAA